MHGAALQGVQEMKNIVDIEESRNLDSDLGSSHQLCRVFLRPATIGQIAVERP